jgi:hypothetical protein
MNVQFLIDLIKFICYIPDEIQRGDVAQLGERGVRNAEARGSIPLISTNFIYYLQA